MTNDTKKAGEYVKKLNIKTPGVEAKAEELSGGNQQKVIMAKWLMRAPKLFLLDEPTRVVVLNRGRIAAEVPKDQIEKDLLMSYCV